MHKLDSWAFFAAYFLQGFCPWLYSNGSEGLQTMDQTEQFVNFCRPLEEFGNTQDKIAVRSLDSLVAKARNV